MRNISYFCIVKHLNGFLKGFLLLLAGVLPGLAGAQDGDILLREMDKTEVSLLTCGPGSEVWSQFGHTAIRVTDTLAGSDIVVNYGMFSFDQPCFIPRFVLGKADYQIDIQSFSSFMREYEREGRYVIQQPLAVTAADKLRILKAIGINFQPENRTYRYNFFYDNCTTRARNVLVDNCQGRVTYPTAAGAGLSYRQLVHRMNEAYPWASFGEDLLLGFEADRKCSQDESQFLPLFLMADFQKATIGNGSDRHPLVKSTFFLIPPPGKTDKAPVVLSRLFKMADGGTTLLPSPPEDGRPTPIPSPLAVMVTALAIAIAVTAYEWRRKRYLWPFDLLLYLVAGAAGLVLLAMVFSDHPTVRANWQILILNPLWLASMWPLMKNRKRMAWKRYRRWARPMAAFILLSVVLNLVLTQHFAKGMYLLALILLMRLAAPLLAARNIRRMPAGEQTKNEKQHG